jgi:hypothetical protein
VECIRDLYKTLIKHHSELFCLFRSCCWVCIKFYSHGSTAYAKLKVGHFVGNNMYKTPSNFYICVRGGAPDLCSPLKILFTDWRLIPLCGRLFTGAVDTGTSPAEPGGGRSSALFRPVGCTAAGELGFSPKVLSQLCRSPSRPHVSC